MGSIALKILKYVGGVGGTFSLFIPSVFSSQSPDIESLPSSLRPYVFYRLGIDQIVNETQKIGALLEHAPFGSIRKEEKKNLYLSEHLLFSKTPLDVNFSIKYKGVKETRGERPSLHLNYKAREAEIAEGFEASENIKSSYQLTPRWKIVSYVGVFERWVDEKIEPVEESIPIMTAEELLYKTKVTTTLKYALGCSWSLPLKKEKDVVLDFFMQHKANQQWDYKNRLFSNRIDSGVLFDHWVMTLTFNF